MPITVSPTTEDFKTDKFIDQEIKIFLANNGFYNVNIKSSKSSYR